MLEKFIKYIKYLIFFLRFYFGYFLDNLFLKSNKNVFFIIINIIVVYENCYILLG